MATTTNYSWTTPDDTDLVKDGAAAIRTLGSAIDTTVFNNAGAAVAKSLIDAEGDLIVGDAADAVQRLAIGSNGNVLTVDTTVDGKIKWAAPAASGFTFQSWTPTFTNLSLGNGTLTARYGTSGKFTHFELFLTFGSTTSVTGVIKFTLPTTPKNKATDQAQYVPTMMLDAGTQIFFGMTQIPQSGPAEVYATLANQTYVERSGTSATVPFTWTTNDELIIVGNYEEA
jgi:hypothetical protein